jgi:predicted AlkP superfamily pyrophosphatase or phosphodiesterase
MRRGLIFGLVLAGLLPIAHAQAAEQRPIVYAVVIDGLDGDRVDEGKAPFISSLLAEHATYYQESRSIMIAETNPNHTAMMTGAYGNASGFPGNAFALYSPLANGSSCQATGPADESKPPTVTSGESPTCRVAETVFEAIRREGNPDGLLTAAIFGKPKLGRIFQNSGVDHLWAPCASGSDDDSYCGNVPTNPVTGYAVDDRTVMDEVLRTIREGIGAQHRRPDFTFVNLHQVDSAGHATGTGPAYDTAIKQADDEIGRLVGELRSRGEWQRTVLILLSDHSMDTTLSKTNLKGAFTTGGIASSDYVVVQNGSVDLVYLADRTSPNRFELLKRMRAQALATDGVNEALYREPNPADGGSANALAGAHPAWHLDGPRTGDLVVTHDPGGAFSDPGSFDNPLTGNHGGPQTRDNFFAVIGGGAGVREQSLAGNRDVFFDDTLSNPGQAENVDVAPTVMGLFGLQPPRDNAGRFLSEAFSLANVPGAGTPPTRAGRPRLHVRALTHRRCARVRRYRLSWTPSGARYDLTRRTRRHTRTLLRNSARTKKVVRLRSRHRYRLRVRMRAASGAPGRWSSRGVRVLRCLRAPRARPGHGRS